MRRLISLLVLVLTTVVLASTPATASADILPTSCGTTSQVFARWSDAAYYYFAPNGGLESGTAGWTLSGNASIVKGNDAFALSGTGSHALTLGTGASATTTVCYGLTYPAIRFVAAASTGTAVIHVRVLAQNLLGVLSVLDGGTFSTGTAWTPAPKLSTLFSALAAPLGTKSMRIRISVDSGSALVDDLYVDPFLTKS